MIKDRIVKGYTNNVGYMGWVDEYGDYMLFSSESDYYDYLYELVVVQFQASKQQMERGESDED